MKILIASDLHGSAYWTERLCECIEEEGPDKVLLLGDLLYHGPRNDLPDGYAPKRVIELLNRMSERLIAVRGNCEAEVDQMVLDFPVMSETATLFVDGRVWLASHGHTVSPDAAHRGSDVFLSGHTHIPRAERRQDCLILNPGSVSIPKEGSAHGYIIYKDGCFYFKDMDGGIYDSIEF